MSLYQGGFSQTISSNTLRNSHSSWSFSKADRFNKVRIYASHAHYRYAWTVAQKCCNCHQPWKMESRRHSALERRTESCCTQEKNHHRQTLTRLEGNLKRCDRQMESHLVCLTPHMPKSTFLVISLVRRSLKIQDQAPTIKRL